MTEPELHHLAVLGLFAAALVTLLSVLRITAPYGRHQRPGWGPTVSSRLGWILMEAPAPLVFLAVFAMGSHRAEPAPLALATLWLVHYVPRALVYPLLLRAPKVAMPLSIAAMGASFNLFNAWLNGRAVSEFLVYPEGWLSDPRFVAGAMVFLIGFGVNQHADAVLRRLRRPGETGYKVPIGGLYRWVSCPNYLGELLEWCGFALAAWSPAGLAFAAYTAANLVPRALAHHRWYFAHFPDYPRERRAVVPFLL